MYLSAGLKAGDYIYLIECFSRCLMSIYIPSGKSRIEAYLPWEYTENNIGMLLSDHNIIIYSPVIDQLLIYDSWECQMTVVKLQGIKADEAGFYYSNILIDQDDFIILPFKGKEIKRYGMNGKLKFKDGQWRFAVARECNCDEKQFGNIRFDSACIIGKQLFFSLLYGNQNFLCTYDLNQERLVCNVIYHSGNVAVKGVYAYPNMVLFRRLFSDKTEIVQIMLDSDEYKTITIDYPSMFHEDIYGDAQHLRVSSENEILSIEGNKLTIYQRIYNFEQSDVYIADGIIFNKLKNEILIPEAGHIQKYSIEKVVKIIRKSDSYQQGYNKLFECKFICEGRYKLNDLIRYLTEFSPVMLDELYSKRLSIGGVAWKIIQ